jgi:hypothetical protein
MYYLLMGHKNNIFSFLFREIDKKENKTDELVKRLDDVYEDVAKIYDHTLNMELYSEMTRDDAIMNLKKVKKGVQDIYEKKEKRKLEIIKNL